MSERWKRIKEIGDEKHYFEISNRGRIRSCRILIEDAEGYCTLEEMGYRYPFNGHEYAKSLKLQKGIAYRDQWFDVPATKYQVNGFGKVRTQKILTPFAGRLRLTHKRKHYFLNVEKKKKEYFPNETI